MKSALLAMTIATIHAVKIDSEAQTINESQFSSSSFWGSPVTYAQTSDSDAWARLRAMMGSNSSCGFYSSQTDE